VGVDLILTESEAVVIEVNPRLTTAYLGVRWAIDANTAALALDACAGVLPSSVPVRRMVRFTTSGRVSITNDRLHARTVRLKPDTTSMTANERP